MGLLPPTSDVPADLGQSLSLRDWGPQGILFWIRELVYFGAGGPSVGRGPGSWLAGSATAGSLWAGTLAPRHRVLLREVWT